MFQKLCVMGFGLLFGAPRLLNSLMPSRSDLAHHLGKNGLAING